WHSTCGVFGCEHLKVDSRRQACCRVWARLTLKKKPMMILPSQRAIGSMPAHDPGTLKVNGTKQILMGLVLAVALLAPTGTLVAAGPAPVNLGSAAQFTILAGAAVTTTGGGIIKGDVGASPITGAAIHLIQAQVNG